MFPAGRGSAREIWAELGRDPGDLIAAFATFAVDRRRIAVGGFSDGASYALCLTPVAVADVRLPRASYP